MLEYYWIVTSAWHLYFTT